MSKDKTRQAKYDLLAMKRNVLEICISMLLREMQNEKSN